MLVGREDHDHIRSGGGFFNWPDRQAGFLGLDRRGGAGPQANDDLDPGIAQVERVSMALEP